MNSAQIAGIIRSIAISLGTILVAIGVIDDAQVVSQAAEAVVAIVGGVITLLAVIHSITAKEKQGVK